jgi:hypothetical protein
MQIVPLLFAGAGGAGAAGGAAAATTAGATAAAGAGGLFGSGISATAILSGAATVAGTLATLSAAGSKANAYKAQAAETEIEAVADDTQAIQKQTAMKRELMRVLGENTVNAAASGIDLGSGLAADTNYDASKRAAQELSIDRSTQDARRAMFRARASGFRQLAKSAKSEGRFAAFGQLAQAGLDMMQRG